MKAEQTMARPATLANAAQIATWAGMIFILSTGLVHLATASNSFDDAFYKGLLFVANGIGAVVAAVGIAYGVRTWGWGLGMAVAGGALIGYVLSRTVGLPGLEAEPDAWFEPLGVVALAAEILFLATAAVALRRARPAPVMD